MYFWTGRLGAGCVQLRVAASARMPAREPSGAARTSTPRILMSSGTGLHSVCQERYSSLGGTEAHGQVKITCKDGGVDGKDAPDEGPRGQHHLEGVGQRHIGAQVAQSSGSGGAEGLGQLRRMG